MSPGVQVWGNNFPASAALVAWDPPGCWKDSTMISEESVSQSVSPQKAAGRMLSTSFIVSASPVLTSQEPLYGNIQQQQHVTQVDPYEAADHIYSLSSDCRRVKRSFSVGRSSDLDLARKINNKR